MLQEHRSKYEVLAQILSLLEQEDDWVKSTPIIYQCNLNFQTWHLLYKPELKRRGLILELKKVYRITDKGKRWLEVWYNLRAVERESF